MYIMRRVLLLVLLYAAAFTIAKAQYTPESRMRVIVDNDFGGDPDGLFHLAEQLLSPTAEVRGIICSPHYKEFYGHPGTIEYARQQVDSLLKVMGVSQESILDGSNLKMQDLDSPLESDGARFIVDEALKDDPRPLYYSLWRGSYKYSQRISYESVNQPAHKSSGVDWRTRIC